MIDTDKYEGHSPQEKWHIDESSVGMGKGFVGSLCLCELCQDEVYLEGSNERELCDEVKANLRLMADVPLFLAEVKRLREGIKVYLKITDERPHNYIRENREKLRELIE